MENKRMDQGKRGGNDVFLTLESESRPGEENIVGRIEQSGK